MSANFTIPFFTKKEEEEYKKDDLYCKHIEGICTVKECAYDAKTETCIVDTIDMVEKIKP